MADEYDERAWDAQDLIGSGDSTQAEYEAEFDKSRAATAVWFAFYADRLEAALESIYEALAAVGPDEVRTAGYGYLAAMK